MKKAMGIGSCIIGVLFVVFGSVMKMKGDSSISVIGGADGPTSVFVAGKLNSDVSVFLILIGVVLLAIAFIVCLKRKH